MNFDEAWGFTRKDNEYNTSFWESMSEEIHSIMVNDPLNFLKYDAIRQTMYSTHPDRVEFQLDSIEEYWNLDRLVEILEDEPELGNPDIVDWGPVACSANSIQQLYHLVKWEYESGTDLRDLTYIVEFGGGYGTMARLMNKINPECNYSIVDVPVMTAAQLFYLSEVCGGSNPPIRVSTTKDWISRNTPIGDPGPSSVVVDLFISTWALSECPAELIVKVSREFEVTIANHILLAYQANSDLFDSAESVVDVINLGRETKVTNIQEVPYLAPGSNWYAFS